MWWQLRKLDDYYSNDVLTIICNEKSRMMIKLESSRFQKDIYAFLDQIINAVLSLKTAIAYPVYD